jgi:hypothetical protein
MASRVTIVEKIDDQRVVGKPTLLASVYEELNRELPPIVQPSLQRAIRRKLGQTPDAHKKTNRGQIRTPLARSRGGQAEAAGSSTEKKSYVTVTRESASGQGAGRGGRGATFGLAIGSPTTSRDGRLNLLNFLISGRRSAGVVTKRMMFWDRYGGEVPVRVNRIKHKAIPADPNFIPSILDQRVMTRVRNTFRKVVTQVISKDALKSYFVRMKVQVDL